MRGLLKFLAVIPLIFAVVFFFRSDFWRIKRVNCQPNGQTCPPDLWADLMNRVAGKNIFFLSAERLSQEIKQDYPEFFQIKIKKQIPDSLFFEIEVRKAVVALGKEEGDYYLVDKDGVLLAKVDKTPALPVVLVAEEIKREIGEKIKDEIILKEIQLLHESQLRLLEPKVAQAISERTIEVSFKDGLEVLFSDQKELKEQLDSLQFILERTKIEGSKPKRIDLRFDKPVITN